jgi:predicted Holliday junction resolvase-like endonuclease
VSELSFFLKENRHIFSICPECGTVHRLSDLRPFHKGYKPDWLDLLEDKGTHLQKRLASLQERAKELQKSAKDRAEREELPKLLGNLAPVFKRWKIDARDVRAVFDPVELVAFEGLNSDDGVQRISFLHLGHPHRLTTSLENAISEEKYRWNTLRLDDDGNIDQDWCDPEFRL